MRRLFPLALIVLAAGLSSARAADADDKAIRDLVSRLFDAFESKDVQAVLALWSHKAPGYDSAKGLEEGLFAATGPIRVKSLTVLRVERDGDSAWVRVRVRMAGNDRKTGEPYPSFSDPEYLVEVVRQGEKWKVWSLGGARHWLMERLFGARTKGERLRMLDVHTDLVGSEFAASMLALGEDLAREDKFDEAARLQDVAFEIAHGLGDAPTLVGCHLYRGERLEMQARYDAALVSYRAGLRLSVDARDLANEETALKQLGNLFEAVGRYPEALQSFRDAHAIAHERRDDWGEADALGKLGFVYVEMGRYGDARQPFQDALRIHRELGNRADESLAIDNIGILCLHMGRYGEAVRHFRDALKISRDQGDREGEANALGNLGSAYQATGRYDEALPPAEAAARIYHDLGFRRKEAHALNSIGSVRTAQGRFDEALPPFRDALQTYRALGDRKGEELVLNNTGAVCQMTGRYGEAMRHYQDAVRIARDLGDAEGEADALNNSGMVACNQGQYAEARKLLTDALRIGERIGSPGVAEASHACLGRTYRAQGRWGDAAEAFTQAARDVEQLRTETREPSLQTSFFNEYAKVYFDVADCRLELKQPAEAFAAGEQMKARGLVDILRDGKADLRRGMSDDERKEEQRLQDRLTVQDVQLETLRGRKADAEAVAALVGDQEKARRNLEDFRRDLYLHRPELQARRAEFAPASLDELGRSLFAGRPGLVVLSYLIGDKDTLLFVLTAGDRADEAARLSVRRLDLGSNDLTDAVNAFRAACADPAAAAPDSEELYRRLIAPAAGALASAKQVVIVPDGVLHLLPFQALQDPDGAFLIERFAVSYAPSVTALTKMEDLGAARRKEYTGKRPPLLAVGVSDFGRRERPLPAAEKEARAVADAFGDAAKLLPGAEATRAKVEASWSDRRYLHFATHGRLNSDDPLYSSLVLSPAGDGDEGVLYAADLLNADVPAELTVMSACETGLGRRVNGEGLLGLSWSWFAAGVPSTVASQWSVGDASTARLMKTFYGRLKAGDSKAEALRQAELTLLRDDATRHPFYWAPFVLVGDDK